MDQEAPALRPQRAGASQAHMWAFVYNDAGFLSHFICVHTLQSLYMHFCIDA